MKLSALLLANALIGLAYALLLLLLPAPFLAVYGIDLANPSAHVLGRLLGAALVGYSVLCYRAREDEGAKRTALVTLFWTDLLALAVALHSQLTVATNSFGWTTVIVYFALTAGYAYFLFVRP